MKELLLLEIKELIKKRFSILVICAVAFAFSAIAISISISNGLIAYDTYCSAMEDYGNKTYYKIILSGDEEAFESFFSGENVTNIKNLFEELQTGENYKFRYSTENIVEFYNDDVDYGMSDFPAYKNECVYGYEEGDPIVREDYLALKAYYIDHEIQYEETLELEKGRWPTEEEYIVSDKSNIVLPVVLGSEYSDLYEIGDCIENGHIATEEVVTFKVVGFLKEGSWFYDNNNEKVTMDRYILVPSVEISDQYVNNPDTGEEYDTFYQLAYASLKIMNARIICDVSEAEIVYEKITELFKDNGLYELRLIDETKSAQAEITETKSLAVTCGEISIVILVFTILTYLIQQDYRVKKDQKKFSILSIQGISSRQIFWFGALETMVELMLADVIFFVFWIWNASRGTEGMGLTYLAIVMVGAIEVMIVYVVGYIGKRRVDAIDMSTLIRRKE